MEKYMKMNTKMSTKLNMKKGLKRTLAGLMGAIFMTSCLFVGALADTTASSDTETFTDGVKNQFSAGNIMTVQGVEASDLIVAGNSASILGSTAQGNIIIAGNQASISDSNAATSVFMAGNVMSLKSVSAGGSIYVAGNNLVADNVEAKALYIAASSVTVSGTFDTVILSGDTVNLSGTVNGDAIIEANEVKIADGTVISGKLTIKSTNEPVMGNVAYGDYSYEVILENINEAKEAAVKVSILSSIISKILSRIYWIFAMAIVAVILCLLFGKQLDEAKDMIVKRTGATILSGVVMWLATPVALILLAITVIGLPTALFALSIYIFSIAIGATFAGASLGRLVFPKLPKILASLIGVFILIILDIVPIIGVLVSIAADMYFMGYIVQKIYFNIKKEENKEENEVLVL